MITDEPAESPYMAPAELIFNQIYFDTCVFQARRLRFSSCSTEELANIKVRSLAAAKATTIGKLNIRGPVVHATLVCSALAVYV